MRNKTAALMGVAALMAGPALAADPATIDWSKIPAKTFTLFYPGQSTYDWLLSPDHKRATSRSRRARRACPATRATRRIIGNKLVKAGPLEPTPIAGKNGASISGAGGARRRVCLFPLPVEDQHEPRRAHARLRAL